MGRDRNPYRLAFLQVVAVAETDERADREYAQHLQAHYRSGVGAIPHTAMAVPGYAEPAAIEGRSPTMAWAVGCTGSGCRFSSSGAARTA